MCIRDSFTFAPSAATCSVFLLKYRQSIYNVFLLRLSEMPEKVNLTEIPNFDLLIFGGRVIDPANGLDGIADVGVRGGVIAAVGADLPRQGAKQLVDATGKLVTPGLIDTHVHVYEGVAPYAFDADEHCLARGSTTVLDCGDAGCNTLEGLKTHVFRRTQCRVLAPVSYTHLTLPTICSV